MKYLYSDYKKQEDYYCRLLICPFSPRSCVDCKCMHLEVKRSEK